MPENRDSSVSDGAPSTRALTPQKPSDETAELVSPASRLGRVLGGRYLIKQELGVGGFGAVFEAEDQRLSKKVAVKILSPEIAKEENHLQRFRQEAIAASKIGHEGIVDVTDFDTDPKDGTTFIVMEYLEGRDLDELISATGAMSPTRSLYIAAQVAYALDAAHRSGIVHRDLKPGNIYILDFETRHDVVKVIDFGISKMISRDQANRGLTAQGIIMGTATYMAPEQGRGELELDGRVDVYALGIILYEMLTGAPPFDAPTFMGVIHQHQSRVVPPPSSINPALAPFDKLILKALAKDPEHRFGNMREFGDAIVAALDAIDPMQASAVRPARMQTALPRPSGKLQAPKPTTFTQASAQMQTAPPAPKRARAWIGVVAALAAVGIIAATWSRDTEQTAPPQMAAGSASDSSSPQQQPEQVAVPEPDDEPTQPADAETVRVRIATKAPGAQAFADNGTPLGSLPIIVDRPAGNDLKTIAVRAPGHVEQTLTLTRASATEMNVVLVKIPPETAPAQKKPPRQRKKTKNTDVAEW